MINLNVRVRRAEAKDYFQLTSLLFYEANTHRHLDWRSALEWLGSQNYWVLDENGFITAAFACPEDPPDIAWIRLFSYNPHLNRLETWSALWEVAQAEIFSNNPRTKVSAIVLKPWFQTILHEHHFAVQQNIALLKLRIKDFKPYSSSQDIRVRRMKESDLSTVAEVDLQAFGTFWHNTTDSIQRAYLQSTHATVAENESGVVGYQISTGNRFGSHLARLGIRPEAQGRGVASALMNELIQTLNQNQTEELSVNTQEDNFASLALYKKFGFAKTGEYFPVMVYHGAS